MTEANRFKFRAWDKATKRMLAPESVCAFIDPMGDGFTRESLVNDGDNSFDVVFNLQRQLVPMQSTGLLDKNGVEIFEGDILRSNVGRIRPSEDAQLYSVVWVQHCWAIRHLQTKQTELIMPIPDFYIHEIIGNIYQTPELIYQNPELLK